MHNFDLFQPETVAQATAMLTQNEAMALAGGQTVIPAMKLGLSAPNTLVSLKNIAQLSGIFLRDGKLRIGSTATHAAVARETKSEFSALAALAAGIGDPAVRNRGTIGGSLANNDPAACYPAAVMACDAVIETNQRSIAAHDFFDGLFSTVLEQGELITAVEFPIPEAACYMKFEQPASRFALAGVFVARFATGHQIAVTGVADTGVFRWTAAETALAEQGNISGVVLPDENLIEDLHGSRAYRAHLAHVLLGRALAQLATTQS